MLSSHRTSNRERQESRRNRARIAPRAAALLVLVPLALGGAAGCTRDNRFQAISMWNESRLKPLEQSPAGGAESSSRVLPAGTVARGELVMDQPRDAAGKLLTKIPYAVTPAVVQRGQERFNIYCSPCHSRLGDGEGLIVKRGFPPPPDYAIKRLRDAPVGHFYDVITNGYGVMFPYSDKVAPNDRWAIAAYIRGLQAARPEVPEEKYQEERLRGRERARGNPHNP